MRAALSELRVTMFEVSANSFQVRHRGRRRAGPRLGQQSLRESHIGGPVRAYGLWRDLSNDEEYPLMVWAFAKKA